MEIKGKEYRVVYEPAKATVTCEGSFRLRGSEYTPIAKLLEDVIKEKPPIITLNVRELRFLNSSGINMLSKFVIKVRKQKEKASKVIVQGCREYPWQRKSLKNLKRLMPTLKLEIT